MTSVFHKNVVIVTGASRGIGYQLSLQLAEQGACLSLASRDEVRLEAVAIQCQERGGQALAVATDVADSTQCERLIARTVDEYGQIDTLINNAGVSMWAHFEELQDFVPLEQIMKVNYFGSVYCTSYALPYLKESGGRIVAVSSLGGKFGVPTRSGYVASKHAMVGFFDSLRVELARYGISVTLVYPDFVATEIRERSFGPDGRPLGINPLRGRKVMTAETCARLIIKAAARRKRELIMSLRGKIARWIKLVFPGLVDKFAQHTIPPSR